MRLGEDFDGEDAAIRIDNIPATRGSRREPELPDVQAVEEAGFRPDVTYFTSTTRVI
jgi:hypothetical protein